MKSDTEINKEIHAKVFGNTDCYHVAGDWDGVSRYCIYCHKEISYQGSNFIKQPDYVNDIASAWRVVERITQIEQANPASDSKFYFLFQNANLAFEDSKSAARLICEMALKALGVEGYD